MTKLLIPNVPHAASYAAQVSIDDVKISRTDDAGACQWRKFLVCPEPDARLDVSGNAAINAQTVKIWGKDAVTLDETKTYVLLAYSFNARTHLRVERTDGLKQISVSDNEFYFIALCEITAPKWVFQYFFPTTHRHDFVRALVYGNNSKFAYKIIRND